MKKREKRREKVDKEQTIVIYNHFRILIAFVQQFVKLIFIQIIIAIILDFFFFIQNTMP